MLNSNVESIVAGFILISVILLRTPLHSKLRSGAEYEWALTTDDLSFRVVALHQPPIWIHNRVHRITSGLIQA